MNDVMANVFLDVHPFKVKLTLFCDGAGFLIASIVSAYFLQQMLLSVVADGSTRLLGNALYDCHSSRFDIVFHGICAETNHNNRYHFHVSW